MKNIGKVRTIMLSLIIVLFAFFGVAIVAQKRDIDVDGKKRMLSASGQAVLCKDWFSKTGVSKSAVASLTLTGDSSRVPDDYISANSVGASDADGEVYDAGSDLIAYVSYTPNNYSNYNIVVYSASTIVAPKDSSNLFSNFIFYTSSNPFNLTIENLDTSNVEKMNSMFSNTYVRELDLSQCNFSTAKVADMSSMFSGMYYISSLDLSKATRFDTSNVTNMSNMFHGCGYNGDSYGLKSAGVGSQYALNFGNYFNTSKVVNMKGMFSGADIYSNSYGRSKFTEIHLNNFNTSNVEDMSSMFFGCSELETINFGSNFKTTQVLSMAYMFYECRSLKKLDLSGFNTSKVTNMDSMFRAMSGLETAGSGSAYSLNFGSNFDVSNVTSMKYMFGAFNYNYYIPGFKEIDLSEWKTSYKRETFDADYSYMFYNANKLGTLKSNGEYGKVNFGDNFNVLSVTNMSYMFNYCGELKGVYLGKAFVPSAVKNFSNMFSYCSSIVGLNLTNFRTTNAVNMSYMFYGCHSLSSLDLKKFQTSKVTDFSYMFAGTNANKSNLSNLTLNFDTSSAENMNGMFRYCNSLTSLELSSFNTSNVTNMSYMFDGCSSISSAGSNNSASSYALNFGNNFYTHNVTTMFSMFQGCLSSSVFDLAIFDTVNVTDMSSMFNNCSNAKKIVLGPLFCTPNVTNMSYMFAGCISLRHPLDLSMMTSENLTTANYMFNNCVSLPNIYFNDGFTLSNVTNLEYLFAGLENLKEIDVSHFVTNQVTNMRFMFYDCASLTSLNLESFDTSNVENMRNMFARCASIDSAGVNNQDKQYSLNFGDNFKTSNVTDMASMFAYCSSLIDLQLDTNNFKTNNVLTASNMFFNCSAIENLASVSNFDTSKMTDMSSMFGFCSNLKELRISNFVIRDGTIIAGLLDACSSLERIVAPNIQGSDNTADLPTIFQSGTSSNTLYQELSNKIRQGTVLNRSGIFLYSSFKSILGSETCQKIVSIKLTNTEDAIALKERADGGIYSVGTGNTVGVLYSNKSSLNAYLIKNDDASMSYGKDMYDCIIYCPNLTIYAPVNSKALFAGEDNGVQYFSNLEKVEVQNFNITYASDLSNLFYNCGRLISVNLRQVNYVQGTTGKDFGSIDFSDMFVGCEQLSYIYTFRTYSSIDIYLPGNFYNKGQSADHNTYVAFPKGSNNSGYAATELARKFVVTLDITNAENFAASGWMVNGNTAQKEFFYNESLGTLPTIRWKNRVFTGWLREENGELLPFATEKNARFDYNKDVELKQSWAQVYLKFNEDNGQYDLTKVIQIATETDEENNTVTRITELERPIDWAFDAESKRILAYVGDSFGYLPLVSRYSHKLLGWFIDDENLVLSTGRITTTETPEINQIAEINLIAKWEFTELEENKRLIVFNANGGSIDIKSGVYITLNENGSGAPLEFFEEDLTKDIRVVRLQEFWKVDSNGQMSIYMFIGNLYDIMPNAIQRDYVFDGWYTEQEGGEAVYSTSMVEDNMVLYAHWVKDTSYENINTQLILYIAIGIVAVAVISMLVILIRKSSKNRKSVVINENFIKEFNIENSEDLNDGETDIEENDERRNDKND